MKGDNNMRYFLGIIPEKNIMESIIAFQKMNPNNKLPQYVLPHITLFTPFVVPNGPELDGKVLKFFRETVPFLISLNGTSTFGNHTVYLNVQSRPLKLFHDKILELLKSWKYSNQISGLNREFVPHLTLGQKIHGLNEKEILEIKEKANGFYFSKTEFLCKDVILFGKRTKESYSMIEKYEFSK